jgi:alkaline phosphatase D
MKVTELKAALTAVFSIGRTPNIIGLHGTGKSSVVYQWAAENGYKVSERRLGQMADAGDLIGLQEFIRDAKTGNATHTKHVLPDWFPREENTLVFLDEVNRAHKDLLQAVFELVYDKSLAGVKLPKNCHVVAASNPATDDYAVLDFSDSAFQDRFVHIQFTPTKEEWIGYGRSQSFAPSVLDFIAEFPSMLENGALQAFDLSFVKPSRRSWEAVSKLESTDIPEDIRLELTMGIVGTEAAHQYTTFKKTYAKTIKAVDILNNYDKVRANVQQLSDKNRNDLLGIMVDELKDTLDKMPSITESQGDNIMALGADLPVEFATAMFKAVMSTKGFTQVEGKEAMSLLNDDRLDAIFARVKEVRKDALKTVEKKKKEKATK